MWGIALTSTGEKANQGALERLFKSVRYASHISTTESLKVVFVTMVGRFVYRPAARQAYLLAPLDARQVVIRSGHSLIPPPPPFRSQAKPDSNVADGLPK